jgi:hypothetical protein
MNGDDLDDLLGHGAVNLGLRHVGDLSIQAVPPLKFYEKQGAHREALLQFNIG